MTRALKSLSEKGLIELMPDAEDKRGKNIRLTEKGKALSEDVIHAILESQGKLWKQSGANEKQIRKLDDALKSMLSNIEASDG
jgi:DNA-binding MarR family transcriptional regulator